MIKGMKICYWLLIPEDLYPGMLYKYLHQSDVSPQYWKTLNLMKGAFWYCLAIAIGILIGNLH